MRVQSRAEPAEQAISFLLSIHVQVLHATIPSTFSSISHQEQVKGGGCIFATWKGNNSSSLAYFFCRRQDVISQVQSIFMVEWLWKCYSSSGSSTLINWLFCSASGLMGSFHSLLWASGPFFFPTPFLWKPQFPDVTFHICLCMCRGSRCPVLCAILLMVAAELQSRLSLQMTGHQLKIIFTLDPIIYGTVVSVTFPVCPSSLWVIIIIIICKTNYCLAIVSVIALNCREISLSIL